MLYSNTHGCALFSSISIHVLSQHYYSLLLFHCFFLSSPCLSISFHPFDKVTQHTGGKKKTIFLYDKDRNIQRYRFFESLLCLIANTHTPYKICICECNVSCGHWFGIGTWNSLKYLCFVSVGFSIRHFRWMSEKSFTIPLIYMIMESEHTTRPPHISQN